MSGSRAPTPRASVNLAEKLVNKGLHREAAHTLLGASKGYRKLGQADQSRRLRLESDILLTISEMINAFESGNFAPALKEARKVKRASKTGGEKKFAQYFESTISIWKNLVEGKRQSAVSAMDKLN